ncbi:MAG: twin-arginine translocation signal domain-containing protein, partial [Paraglaciecola chathamensis]
MTNRRDFLKGTMQGLAAGAMASALPNFAQARDLSP